MGLAYLVERPLHHDSAAVDQGYVIAHALHLVEQVRGE
jgi:hypothetical protein